MYWKDIGTTVDTVFAHTYTNNTIYQRPIYPLGQTYQSPPSSQIIRFRQLADAYGAPGVSWWDWQETPSALWASLGSATPALTGFTPTTAMPALKAGAKGDQIVWLQEHLKTGDPGLKVDGQFGASTTAAVKAFQAVQGLPSTGVMDVPTWNAVLAVEPTMQIWNSKSATAARAPRSATIRATGRRDRRQRRLTGSFGSPSGIVSAARACRCRVRSGRGSARRDLLSGVPGS